MSSHEPPRDPGSSAPSGTTPPPVDRNDLGFGSVVARQSRERLLNRDGSFNVRRDGLGFFQSLSLYHSLLNMSWPRFLLVLTGGFLGVNFVFACIYFAAGPDALSGLHWTTTGSRFLGCFFFSVQTFATIGYGSIAPATQPDRHRRGLPTRPRTATQPRQPP